MVHQSRVTRNPDGSPVINQLLKIQDRVFEVHQVISQNQFNPDTCFPSGYQINGHW
jgi:hypothetical protein